MFSVLESSVTEAWLRVRIVAGNDSDRIVLTRNGETVLSQPYRPLDTIIADNGLVPNTMYKYRLSRIRNDVPMYGPHSVTILTRDTTAHDFFITNHTVPGHLTDVCITGEGQVLVTGNIPSGGQSFNLVWVNILDYYLARVMFDRGDTLVYAVPVCAIAVDKSSILVSDGICVMHFDGKVWARLGSLTRNGVRLGYIGTMWGRTINDIWTAGPDGSILHWDGRSWSRIPNPFPGELTDITGTFTGYGKPQTRFFARKGFATMLTLTGNQKVQEFVPRLPAGAGTIWSRNGLKIFAGGDVLWTLTGGRWDPTPAMSSVRKIRGNEDNDIVAVGTSGVLGHFNGMTWVFRKPYPSASYVSAAVTEHTIAAIGTCYGSGLVTTGRR
jgi:hypothetical protein